MNCKNMPVMKTSCATCPFRDDSPYRFLKEDLTKSALTEASRICHSTGSNNGINRRTGKRSMICRGARDVQLRLMAGLGVIKEPTDAAWAEAAKELCK